MQKPAQSLSLARGQSKLSGLFIEADGRRRSEGRSWRIADNARDNSQRPEYIASRAPERRKWAGQWTLELGVVSAPSRSSARTIQRAAILFRGWRQIRSENSYSTAFAGEGNGPT